MMSLCCTTTVSTQDVVTLFFCTNLIKCIITL